MRRWRGSVGRGWSLLELLVVMGIIVVLAAMMVPALWQLLRYVRSLGGEG